MGDTTPFSVAYLTFLASDAAADPFSAQAALVVKCLSLGCETVAQDPFPRC